MSHTNKQKQEQQKPLPIKIKIMTTQTKTINEIELENLLKKWSAAVKVFDLATLANEKEENEGEDYQATFLELTLAGQDMMQAEIDFNVHLDVMTEAGEPSSECKITIDSY